MLTYLVRRIGTGLFVLLLISIGLFTLIRMAPGDPVAMIISPEQMSAPGADEFVARTRAELGLDKPIVVQYLIWLGNALTGDLGNSFADGRPVVAVIGERLGPTLYLMGLSLALALIIALPVGMIAAARKNSGIDYSATILSLAAVCIPPFFLGIIGIYVFSLKLGWLPSSGMSDPRDLSPLTTLSHLVMPLAILAFGSAGVYTRYIRTGVIGELSSDYVRTALAKGASEKRVLLGHVLQNALIPLITVVAIYLPGLLAGAVVIETVFAWPGMGQLVVDSIGRRNYPVIIGVAMAVAVLVLISNIIADFLYSIVDPRVTLS